VKSISPKQQRQLATLAVAGSGLGLTVYPQLFSMNIFGTVTAGLIIGLIDFWVAYSLYKNKF